MKMTGHVSSLNDIKTKENETRLKRRRDADSKVSFRRSRFFLPHAAPAHLRSFIPFSRTKPDTQLQLHAAYGARGEEKEREGWGRPRWKWKCFSNDVRRTENVVDENVEADDDAFSSL